MKMKIYMNMFLVALTFFRGTSRLKSKDTVEEDNQLKGINIYIYPLYIYMPFDSPLILHCDKALECQGILLLIYCLHLLTGQ